MKGPVFCFPGVVVEEGGEGPRDLHPALEEPVWRDRLAGAPDWLHHQVRTVGAGMAAHERMRRHGVEPAVVTSHSLGIYAALFAAGSIDADSALRVAWTVGTLLEENLRRSPGGLLAVVGLTEGRVEEVVRAVGGTLKIASRNTASQFVLGGADRDLARAEGELADALHVERIRAGGALHTDLVEPIIPRLGEFVRALPVRAPMRPYLCHRGAAYLETEADVREALVHQIRDPVLWHDCIERLGREGARTFLDMGPGSVLQKTVRWVLRRSRALSLAEGDSPEAVLAAVREGATPQGDDGR